MNICSRNVFHVNGNQPQLLNWEGHGFELHLPEGTCLPNEQCVITVEVAVWGDFVFPSGVEPVSAIYIISISPKLQKNILLKIQHCVALDKTSNKSCLSFYRASLKELKPPYNFRHIKGGKFDIKDHFGELELRTFCAMAIGKDSPSSSEDLSPSERNNQG